MTISEERLTLTMSELENVDPNVCPPSPPSPVSQIKSKSSRRSFKAEARRLSRASTMAGGILFEVGHTGTAR